jgi:hypothetical protein
MRGADVRGAVAAGLVAAGVFAAVAAVSGPWVALLVLVALGVIAWASLQR